MQHASSAVKPIASRVYRCPRPDSEFRKAAMGRTPAEGRDASGVEAPIAARENFKPRGQEHGLALNT